MLHNTDPKPHAAAPARRCHIHNLVSAVLGAVFLATLTGCSIWPWGRHAAPENPPEMSQTIPGATQAKSLVLQPGDTIKITFPGAANLDTIQVVRRDGKISLSMIGEYDAAGKAPSAVEADLKRLYAAQIVNSEATVTVQSSAFVIYVMGAVNKPGRVISDRVLTPLEALIECGVDQMRSNLKRVQVIRTDDTGHTQKFYLDLSKVLHKGNEQMPPFVLKPYDIINVPERFVYF